MFGNAKITKEVFIDGMSCIHCAAKVEKALKSISGVSDVTVDLENKKAVIKLKKELDNSLIKTTIEELEYTVVKI